MAEFAQLHPMAIWKIMSYSKRCKVTSILWQHQVNHIAKQVIVGCVTGAKEVEGNAVHIASGTPRP